MNWVKGFALVTCLATPLSVIVATGALADPAASTTPAPAAGSTPAPAADGMKKSSMSADEKKAKATDCSKQADAKKLHGEERRKFRLSCKKM